MTMKTPAFTRRATGAALALSIGLALSGCGGMPSNRSLNSVHEPIVEQTNYTLDVGTGGGGLPFPEQRRLAGWFAAMNLKYGDRIYIDDPVGSSATRGAIEVLAGRYGILVSDDAPVTPGFVAAGTTRVIIARSKASVPGCPDWSAKSDVNLGNATSSNYGCATNSNLAAMVANPEHLIRGADTGSDTLVMSSNKAIQSYRKADPTSADGLTKAGAKEN
ncbi:CpaD family pilus assembly protein [Novosphingobium album (ex Liu et al. 2023)]|uniref:CpaD family pilus assembly protein n=1 Tax=Novosphingobium album (ex Liu et al. 2023) TaxID=3031130 RepID=A0ABT5WRC8_9SPHN|nr:CpaD family pilus assembly protein [Novosphingobium album (ex Liu et al. 2023)]MDE8652610.1 CpaD family pilus assembly protein [Novosphingobium album (ex Liu et al. 2023)]